MRIKLQYTGRENSYTPQRRTLATPAPLAHCHARQGSLGEWDLTRTVHAIVEIESGRCVNERDEEPCPVLHPVRADLRMLR